MKFDATERFERGHEVDLGAAAVGGADDRQRRDGDAVAKLHLGNVAVAPDPKLQPRRQRVDDGDADPVQAAGDLVAVLVELAAGVQLGHHDLGRRALLLVVVLDVDRYAASVVDHRHRIVGVDDDLDVVAEAGERLVDRVVQDLEHHVVKAGAVGGVADVHPRALAHRFETFQHLDAVRVVLFAVGSGFAVGWNHRDCRGTARDCCRKASAPTRGSVPRSRSSIGRGLRFASASRRTCSRRDPAP